MENKINVTKEACNKRLTAKRENDIKTISKIASAACAVSAFSIISTLVIVVLVIVKILNIAFVVISALLTALSLCAAGDMLEKKKKLEEMSNEEYIAETLKGIKAESGDEIICPYCGSVHVTFHKKGFNEGKALLGIALIGYWGAFWGVPGRNKIKGTCLKCGRSWTIKRK